MKFEYKLGEYEGIVQGFLINWVLEKRGRNLHRYKRDMFREQLAAGGAEETWGKLYNWIHEMIGYENTSKWNCIIRC